MGALGGLLSGVGSTVQGAASTVGGWVGEMGSPVIGPLGPTGSIEDDDGYFPPPEGDVWKGAIGPEDLFGEDNGPSSNRQSPWRAMADKVRQAAEQVGGEGGGGMCQPPADDYYDDLVY